MRITHKLNTDLSRQPVTQILEAVQGDANTRCVELHLLEGGAAWTVPAGVTAAVAFRKSDGHKGLYDTLPDGSAAVTISGSTVTAILAPQVLSCAGDVAAAVVLSDEDLNRLAAFPVTIHVAPDPSGGAAVSNDYYRYSTMEAVNTAMEEFFAAAEGAQAAFIQRTEGAQASFLDTAGKALEALHAAVTEEAPAIVCDPEGELLSLTDASDRPLRGLTLYGRTTQNGTPAPEAPVALESAGASGSIGVSVTGKNLFGGEALADRLVVAAKATKDTEAGTVTFNAGNIGGDIIFNAFKPNTRYTFILYGRNSRTDSRVVNMNVSYTDGSTSDRLYFSTIGEDSYAVLTSAANKTVRYIFGNNYGGIVTLYYDKCGIFEGVLTEADFVPYEGQTLTVSTPNGLPGVPVSSGGNYTDANGQQWVCDEIDFAKGVYVQRVGKVDFATLEWTPTDFSNEVQKGYCANTKIPDFYYSRNNFLHSHYRWLGYTIYGTTPEKVLGTSQESFDARVIGEISFLNKSSAIGLFGVVVGINDGTPVGELQYVLTTPIETPLPAEEPAAFAALHTYKPDTTVSNDSGAGMGVSYIADTKHYIDNQFTGLRNAILSAGANI